MTDQRPYVVPKITDQGTIRLLFSDSKEFDLLPRDAAELGIQLLRAYCATYGPIHVDIGDGDKRVGGLSAHAEKLTLYGTGVRLFVPGDRNFREIEERVLRDVRRAIGCKS